MQDTRGERGWARTGGWVDARGLERNSAVALSPLIKGRLGGGRPDLTEQQFQIKQRVCEVFFRDSVSHHAADEIADRGVVCGFVDGEIE